MDVILAVLVGILYSAAMYMLLRRSITKWIIGLGLLGHASNLLIFTVGRLTKGSIPIIPPEAKKLIGPFADPLPQALILTAIVIGFGVQAFAIVLIRKVYEKLEIVDIDKLTNTED